MTRSPILSGQEIIKILQKIGYREIRQSDSHFRLACPNRKSATAPNYKTISGNLLRKILRDIEISVKEFLELS